MSAFELMLFDTYGVAFLRSPRYLEDPLVEEIDQVTRDLVDEARTWSLLSRRHRLTASDVEALHDHLAAKYCKNLDVWKHLPEWSARARLGLVHGGPAGLLERWARAHDLERYFSSASASGRLGVGRGDPHLYARLAAEAGVPPARCLLVDDERAPIEAAREAGFGVYRFGTVFGLRALLAEADTEAGTEA